MSKKICTVYFDTEFYVQLGRADKAEANKIVRSLNELNVRHVISNVLIQELQTSKHGSDFNEALVKRVGRFKVPPYHTEDDVAWEGLLQSGQGRVDVATHLQDQYGELKAVMGFPMRAGKLVDPQDANPEDYLMDISEMFSLTKAMLGRVGVNFNTDVPENPTLDDLRDVSNQVKRIMDPSVIAKVAEQFQVEDPLTPTSAKRSSDKPPDTEHIMLFIQHQDEIDLLQVEKRHEAIINRAKPKHRLARLGLVDRCFSADSLTDTVAEVRKFCATR